MWRNSFATFLSTFTEERQDHPDQKHLVLACDVHGQDRRTQQWALLPRRSLVPSKITNSPHSHCLHTLLPSGKRIIGVSCRLWRVWDSSCAYKMVLSCLACFSEVEKGVANITVSPTLLAMVIITLDANPIQFGATTEQMFACNINYLFPTFLKLYLNISP